METIIKAADFLDLLKNEGLVIVSKKELEKLNSENLLQIRKDLMRKKWITISQVLKMELLPVKTKTSIERWIKDGTIKQEEVTKKQNGIILINANFLNRLGYV